MRTFWSITEWGEDSIFCTCHWATEKNMFNWIIYQKLLNRSRDLIRSTQWQKQFIPFLITIQSDMRILFEYGLYLWLYGNAQLTAVSTSINLSYWFGIQKTFLIFKKIYIWFFIWYRVVNLVSFAWYKDFQFRLWDL